MSDFGQPTYLEIPSFLRYSTRSRPKFTRFCINPLAALWAEIVTNGEITQRTLRNWWSEFMEHRPSLKTSLLFKSAIEEENSVREKQYREDKERRRYPAWLFNEIIGLISRYKKACGRSKHFDDLEYITIEKLVEFQECKTPEEKAAFWDFSET